MERKVIVTVLKQFNKNADTREIQAMSRGEIIGTIKSS